jgi:hypothetical protein
MRLPEDREPVPAKPLARRRAPPFKQRVETTLAAARAAGAERIKIVTPDGAAFEIDFAPATVTESNDFDRPSNVAPLKRRTRP